MSYLPAQQNTTHTYYQRGIAAAIDRLTPEDPEAAVTAIWVSILGFVFPALDGYHVRPEQLTDGGFADLYMIHFNLAVRPVREYHFCIIQCKRVSAESSGRTWRDARAQLLRYLPGLKPKRRRHQVYGAVAVGRWVEFYMFRGAVAPGGQNRLMRIPGYTRRLHIAHQCRTVTSILEFIRANHT